MKNQKICIIGDGLAGLSTTLTLKNLNIEIDVYYKKNHKFITDSRTTAISESNFQFLNKQERLTKSLFWPCKKINLYYENKNNQNNFLNYSNDDKNLMYIFENKKFKSFLNSKLKKQKNVKFIKKKISNIDHENSSIIVDKKKYYYDLIILCLGSNSKIYNNLFKNRIEIKKDYNEFAFTGTIQHNHKIINPSQYFLPKGPLAILPFSKNKFSFVWSLKKELIYKNKNKLKQLISSEIERIYKKIKFKVLNFQTFPLNLNLKTQYSINNVLVFGEGIHSIHPVAGQGFNLVIRDIKKLNELINDNLKLGMEIKNSFILKDFYNYRSSENLMFGLGIDLTHSFFKNRKYIEPIKNIILNNIKSNKLVKKLSTSISDRGFF